jgi:predicted thioredoxin/glutaredoxin
MPVWTVYSRAECSLCEEMLAQLSHVLGPQAASQVAVVDIDQDPGLQKKYGHRVPVLLADGELVCAYRLDEERVRAYLAGS